MTTIPGTPTSSGIPQLQEALRLGLAVVTELWFHSTTDWVTSVHAADIDGDGDLEVLLGSRDGKVRVLTRKGRLKWQHTEANNDWVGSVYGINNIEAVDQTRVVAGTRNNTVAAFDEMGQVLWQYQTDQVARRVRVFDINQDGKAEVIIGSEDSCVHVLACETGELLWKFESNGWIRSVFPIDLDGDGQIETLAASGDKSLYVLDSCGKLKQEHATGSKIHALCVADLDQDGIPEVLIGSDAKDLYAMKPDGQKLWQFSPQNRIHSINVADLDGDGRLEVIAASEDEHIYFLDSQGNLLWQHFLGHRIFSIFAVDLNRDGIWEILVGAEDNNAHVLRVELSEGLLAKIINSHKELGQPHSSTLKLSATEETLLHDLADEPDTDEQGITMAQVEQLLASHDYLAALSALLHFKQLPVQLLWTRDVGHIRSAVLLKQPDSSDTTCIIGTDEGEVKQLDLDGNVLWSYAFGGRIRTVDVSDLDQDGLVEIIAGDLEGHVYVLDSSGQTVRWKTQLNTWIESICTIDALDQSSPELVLCSTDHKIRIYTGTFTPVIEPIVTPQSIRVVQTHDLDGDGRMEIIAGALDDKVYAYTREGQELWSYNTLDRVRAFSVRDIDHDGHPEILVCSEDRSLHVLDHMGNLKWRYYTPHRLLDVDAVDAQHNGQVQVFVGAANGLLYVLNSVGDLLWQFKANDRIRVVRLADMNQDGCVELLLGSEDRLYLLQMVDQTQVQTLIEHCWQMVLEERPLKNVLYELVRHADPRLRASALTNLVSRSDFFEGQGELLNTLLADGVPEVKKALAASLVPLHYSSPQSLRTFLELLSTDRERDIRLAFIDGLPALCQINPQSGFEYLERFTRNTNKWIRRAVVRNLDQLVVAFPQQVFDLLMHTIEDGVDMPIFVDGVEWIRQESARTLAHYLDIHPQNLLKALRLLTTKGLEPSLFQVVINCATTPLVRNTFRVVAQLLSPIADTTILPALKETVEVLEATRLLSCGEAMYQIYTEFYRLHRIRTIEEVAQYKCMLETLDLSTNSNVGDAAHFGDTLRVLQRINIITAVLRTYLRREGLGDRIASLLEATTLIDELSAALVHAYFTWSNQKECFPDYWILKLLLTRWRSIVTTELGRLRGKAELSPELQTRQVQHEEHVGILLCIHNNGRSPADHITLTLKPDVTYSVVGHDMQTFETIPTHEPVYAEFTVMPHSTSLSLAFEIIYDDAEGKEKNITYGDRLELIDQKREFKRFLNPYRAGLPIHGQDMFYGREEELAALQEDFVYSSDSKVVVLYGQRRSGKSSLLYQLLQTSILEPHIPIRIDMQQETLEFSTSRFLYKIAYYIAESLGKRNITVAMPQKYVFEEDATFALDLFLDAVEVVLKERKLVILIDEFEILEQKVTEKELDRNIFVYLRSLMQHRRSIHFLLAGLHTITDLTAAYWSVFFNIASHRRLLSHLTEDAAKQLITKPLEGLVEYDPFAIKKIRHLTGDQPYLIQLICHSLAQHCNTHHKSYITINDVNIVLERVMETGNVYFSWIWDQASKEERAALSIVAHQGGDDGSYVSLTDIERIYHDNALPYTREHVLRALRNLRDGDFIAEVPQENRFKIPIGLTRVWLRETKPLQRVILEERLLDLS